MKIRTFIGLIDYVEQCVNAFSDTVEVMSIQTHATGRESMMATVIYEEGSENGR